MPEFQCQSCGYRFERTRLPYSCPYCGNVGTVSTIPTAQDLIEETVPEEKKETR